MPYFHSAINVSKWLLLSSWFDFQWKWFIKKVGGGESGGWGCRHLDVYVSLQTSTVKRGAEQALTASSWPALPPLTSRRQQWADSADRRLPLTDYNLWSISIIGGVCTDSYSNNYLDQTVSKATTPPPTTQHANSAWLCLPACLVIVKKSLNLSFEHWTFKNKKKTKNKAWLFKIMEPCL